MKKLLGLLGILTITSTTIPTNVLNNSLLTKLENSNSNLKELNKHKHLKTIIDQDQGKIQCVSVDSKNNIYFGKKDNNSEQSGLYKTSDEGKTITKIVNISSDIYYTFVDKKDNIYFGTSNKSYLLKQGETIPIIINGFYLRTNEFVINNSNDIYFLSSDQNNGNQIYVLENGNTIPHKTDFDAYEVSKIAIDKNDNIYYASRNNDINEHIYIIKYNEKCSEKIGTIPYGLVNIIMLDSENNIFVGTTFYTYIFKQGENIIKRIDRLNEISFIVFDQENNAYFTNYQSNNIYTLSKNQIAKQIPIAKKIVELETNKKISSVTFNRNNIYFCANDICYSDIYKLV